MTINECVSTARLEQLADDKMICKVSWDERIALARECLLRRAADKNYFMYGIADGDGKPHLDEFCVSTDIGLLENEVVELNDQGGDYRIVALHTAIPLTDTEREELQQYRAAKPLNKENQLEKVEPVAINFDPNMTLSGHIAKQVVSMTFGLWEYRGTFEVEVCGNLTGLEVIHSAIEKLYESLPYTELPFDKGGYATITLGELISDDEDQRGEEWLSEMLISAEIISIEDAGTW